MDNLEMAVIAGSAAVTGIIAYYWRKESKYLKYVKDAPRLNVNQNLHVLVDEAPNKTIPYAVIEGSVQAIGRPLKSDYIPDILGVIQTIICREHKTYWSGSTRLWHDTTRLMRNVSRSIPFVIKNKKGEIKVDDPLSAVGLDIPAVYDSFEPSSSSLGENIVGWASGEKTKGFQTMERMLSEGTLLTGVGMISTSTGSLVLGPPTSSDRLYLLGREGIGGLLRGIQTKLTQLRYILAISGSITALLLAVWLYRRWKHYSEQMSHELQVERVLQNRADSSQEASDVDPPDDGENSCTICLANRRDVVLLECGHVCTCARCARLLQPPQCPICRQRIKRVVPLYNV